MGVKSTLSAKYATVILLTILLLSGLLAFFSLKEGHDWGGDFALYLRQAQSLLDGNSRELLAFNRYAMEHSSEGSPSNPQIGPYLYPWGFPLLLAPLVAVAGYQMMVLKGYMIFFFLLSLLVCYHLFKPRLGRAYSLMLLALLAFNPFLLGFTDVIFADFPFLFFSLLTLLFIEKTLGYRPWFINKTVTYLLTGFLMLFSFMVRTNGIVLLGVVGFGHLLKWYGPLTRNFSVTVKKEWRELLPYSSFAAFLLIAKLVLPGGSDSHLAFLKRITPGKLAWNLMYYTKLPVDFFQGVLFPMLLYGVSLPFLVVGIWHRWWKKPDMLYLLFCIGSMAVFILWPPVQGLRFIFPLLPFYLYFVFRGLLVIQYAFQRREYKVSYSWVSFFTVSLAFLFLFSSLKTALSNFPDRQLAEGPYTAASSEAFTYLEKNTDPQEVIIFFKPRVLSFMIDRQSLRVTKLSEIEEGKGDYLLYYKPDAFGQLLSEEYGLLKSQLQPVFENSEYVLYQLDKIQRRPGSLAEE